MSSYYHWTTEDGKTYMRADYQSIIGLLEDMEGDFSLTDDEELLDRAISEIRRFATYEEHGESIIDLDLIPDAEELDKLCHYKLFV